MTDLEDYLKAKGFDLRDFASSAAGEAGGGELPKEIRASKTSSYGYAYEPTGVKVVDHEVLDHHVYQVTVEFNHNYYSMVYQYDSWEGSDFSDIEWYRARPVYNRVTYVRDEGE